MRSGLPVFGAGLDKTGYLLNPNMAGSENVVEHICDYKDCGKKFKKAQRLLEHKRGHTGERPCMCKECHKTFIRDIHLKRHMLSHNATKTFSCTYKGCMLMFTSKHFRKRHFERAHNRPYKCSNCTETFKRRRQLKIHAYVHTNEMPFRCKERGCYRAFKTPVKLKSHKKLHDLGFHNYFPRVRNDRFAHKWLERHIKEHKCPIFCQC